MNPRQIEVNKNKILDWLKEDNIPHKEIDVSKIPALRWNILIEGGQVAIYAMNNLPDRVIIQADINFTEEQQNLINKKWDEPKLSKLLLNILSSLTNFNVRHRILQKENKEIRGFRMNLFLIDGLNKESLMNSILRIGEVFLVTLNQLSSVIGVELQKLEEQQKAASFNPLAT